MKTHRGGADESFPISFFAYCALALPSQTCAMPGEVLGLAFVRAWDLRVPPDTKQGKLMPGDGIRLDDPPRSVKAYQLSVEDGIIVRRQQKDVASIQAFVARAFRPVLYVTRDQQGLDR